LSAPPVHIYYSALWEGNFMPMIYDILDHFIGTIHLMIFKENAPTFSEYAKALVSTMGDWYIGE
jgi:hypothetical protein